MKAPEIISLLPYTAPFLFVDALEEISKNGVLKRYIVAILYIEIY